MLLQSNSVDRLSDKVLGLLLLQQVELEFVLILLLLLISKTKKAK